MGERQEPVSRGAAAKAGPPVRSGIVQPPATCACTYPVPATAGIRDVCPECGRRYVDTRDVYRWTPSAVLQHVLIILFPILVAIAFASSLS